MARAPYYQRYPKIKRAKLRCLFLLGLLLSVLLLHTTWAAYGGQHC